MASWLGGAAGVLRVAAGALVRLRRIVLNSYFLYIVVVVHISILDSSSSNSSSLSLNLTTII